MCICNFQTVVLNPKWNLATSHFFCILITQRAGPEDRVLYIANDTEIRSFVYPFNQSHGHKVLARIEENARIIGMDALLHQQKFIWATQFNPGGLFYKEIIDRSQTKTNDGIIVSIGNYGKHVITRVPRNILCIASSFLYPFCFLFKFCCVIPNL